MDYATLFAQALSYSDFLAKYAKPDQLRRWQGVHDQVRLSEQQRSLLSGFKREMPVLVLAGAWCGDCIDQCPIFAHFEAIAPVIKMRYLDRDENPEFAAAVKICGGARVPTAVFLSEDFFEVARFGDKTLSKFRSLAAQNAGTSCSVGLGGAVDRSAFDQSVQEWLDVFERSQLILRLSARLREKHGD